MKNIISKLLRESLLDEDFDSTNEILELSEEIFIFYCKILTVDTKDFEKFPIIEPFSLFIKGDYTVLSDFINEYELLFNFERLSNGARGIFRQRKTRNGGMITISRGGGKLTRAVKTAMNIKNFNDRFEHIYYKAHDSAVISVIVHELQHAYDAWRSGGKFTHSKETFTHKDDKIKGEKSYDSLYKSYLKLPHEISARFEQAIKDIKFNERDWDNNRKFKITTPWDSIYKSFKLTFNGWEDMTPKIQKNLTRRLSQYYHKYDDLAKLHNKKAHEKEFDNL